MKFIYLIFFLFILQKVSSQQLPDDFEKQPDGISIKYFDYSNQKKLISSEIFLGEKLKFKFSSHNNYNRIDISQKKAEIEIIRKNLTYELIENILKCCREKRCPDSIKGYFLMIKKGNKIEYVTIDYNFISPEKCGTDQFSKIIDSFQKL